jgi:hypothetical protein
LSSIQDTTIKRLKHTNLLLLLYIHTFIIIHTEASQILLQDAHVLPKLLSCEEYCSRDITTCHVCSSYVHRRLIAVFLRCKCCAVNLLVAFYDIHGRERCYSFILSRTPHEIIILYLLISVIQIPIFAYNCKLHRIACIT